MGRFIGNHECKIDSKARAIIPAAIKKQLLATGETFVLKKAVLHPCIELYPLAEWEKILEKLSELNPYDPEVDLFIRKFQDGIKIVDIDTTGRLLIAKDLATYANITKDIVLTSKINIIEIWDAELYQQANAISNDDYKALTQNIMAKIYPKI